MGKAVTGEAQTMPPGLAIRRCQILPGQELFRYLNDDGAVHSVGSAHVNEYLQAAGDGEFSARVSVPGMAAYTPCSFGADLEQAGFRIPAGQP